MAKRLNKLPLWVNVHANLSSYSGSCQDFLIVGSAAKKSIARLVTRATTGDPSSHHKIRLIIDPPKAKISILSAPPVPYLIASKAIIVGAMASLTATQIVSSAPLAL